MNNFPKSGSLQKWQTRYPEKIIRYQLINYTGRQELHKRHFYHFGFDQCIAYADIDLRISSRMFCIYVSYAYGFA